MSLPFDQEQYRTEVLDPARRNTQELPGDLLVRYAVPPAAEVRALPTPKVEVREPVGSPRQGFLNQQDAPPCHTCGAIMYRSGACYKCNNCGATSGCS